MVVGAAYDLLACRAEGQVLSWSLLTSGCSLASSSDFIFRVLNGSYVTT